MNDYEIVIDEIYTYIYRRLPITKIGLTRDRFQEQSYIRWALYEILELLYNGYFDIPEHISGRMKPDIFDVIDSFIFKMENLLSIKYNWAFDVGKHAAIQFKVYLKNEEVI